MDTKKDIGSKGFAIAALVLSGVSWILKGPFMYFNALGFIFGIVGLVKGIKEKSVLWIILSLVAIVLSYEVFYLVS